MVSSSLRYGVVALVAVIVTLVFRLTRAFFWSHSLIVGLAAAALVFSTWRTLDRWRPRHQRHRREHEANRRPHK